MTTNAREETLLAIFLRFLRFGFLAWGGPVAQIALIKRELVEEQRWIEPSRFNRLLAIYQVLPGPEAHELCVHFGMLKRGRLGGFLAGLGFMLPGLVLILIIAWLYQRLDLHDPRIAIVFLGIQIGVISLIVRAVHRIADHTLTDPLLWAIGPACAAGAALDVSFWITLPAAGLTYAALSARRYAVAIVIIGVALLLAVLTTGNTLLLGSRVPTGTIAQVPWGSVAPLALFLSGLKAGLLTFGGAYTAIPFVRGDAVGRGWISEGQFLDSLALSGIIPAPLIIFATFVGYVAGGLPGALAMTAGIFMPAFAFAFLFYERLEQVVENEHLHTILEGVAAGVVGLIGVTAIQLAWNVSRSVPSLPVATIIFAIGLAVLYLWRSKLNVPAVVLGSAAMGGLFFS
ncbi:chromate efflux transporter [Sphingomonas sabuli]|uniref:Chromate efflux transporter n=1 Tax=Sphingomonas sabuli TaxID=2764186 RepID=A0A7G9L1X2_9SPHN|nr:chromate efflux transporter [Sphingomonas sabuli]QNM82621.1 chromate efflux transporter [Sphingomonas sabuli]